MAQVDIRFPRSRLPPSPFRSSVRFDSDFKVHEMPIAVLIILFGLPHTAMWAAFCLALLQWSSIIYQSRSNNLNFDIFKACPCRITAMCLLITFLIWGSFAVFLIRSGEGGSSESPLRLLGPVLMALMALAFAGSIFALGMQTVDLMRRLKGDHQRSARLLGFSVRLLSACLVVQSTTWILAVLFLGIPISTWSRL